MSGPQGSLSPLRVLLVAQQLRRAAPGGIGTYVRGLLQGLATGSDPHPRAAVTLYAGRSQTRPDPLLELGHRVRTPVLPAPALSRLWAVGLHVAPGGWDVVHAPSLDAPPARRTPLVVTVHDLAWRQVPDAFPRRGRRWHEAAFRRVLEQAAAVVVPSAPVADALRRHGARPQLLHVIAHGSDHLPAPDEASAGDLLGRLGVGGSFALAVGTLEPRKNLERLLAAHQLARRSWSTPLPLVVVGPRGWGRLSGHLPDQVLLAGPVPPATLAALYRRARLLAFVPLMEGFGLPPLEAMAAGTPVLASTVPSVGDAALVVDPLDVTGIANGFVRLAGDDELRRELSERGLARAAAHRWVDSAAGHLRLWESVSS